VALLLDEEAARARPAVDDLPLAYRAPWRRAGMLEAVAPVAPPMAVTSRPLWQMVHA
jgi:hypothetical protein